MDDDKIVQLYWERDELAVSVTSQKYGSYCTSIARNILAIPEDVEECVNDTYLHAWNAMPPHRPRLLSTFLGKITRNLSFSRYRYNTAHRRGGGSTAAVLDEIAEIVSGTDGVESEFDRLELVSAINAFLNTLPAGKRNMFVRRYWYSDSISSISSRFGTTEGHVYVILSRLRAKLRCYLSERGFDI